MTTTQDLHLLCIYLVQFKLFIFHPRAVSRFLKGINITSISIHCKEIIRKEQIADKEFFFFFFFFPLL